MGRSTTGAPSSRRSRRVHKSRHRRRRSPRRSRWKFDFHKSLPRETGVAYRRPGCHPGSNHETSEESERFHSTGAPRGDLNAREETQRFAKTWSRFFVACCCLEEFALRLSSHVPRRRHRSREGHRAHGADRCSIFAVLSKTMVRAPSAERPRSPATSPPNSCWMRCSR